MAQSYIDKYVFALMLDSSNFEKGANLATKAANGIKSTLLKTYTALGGIDLFKNMLGTYTDAARSIDALSLTTGENIIKLQAWEKTIQDTGGNIGSFRGTISKLNDSIARLSFGEVDDTIATMGKLGIFATDSSGRLKKATDLLLEISNAVNMFQDNAQAFTWAKAMGLDESTFKLMRRYNDSLDEAIKKNEHWAIIRQSDIINARNYDKMISSFKTAWLELSKTIMSAVLPVIQKDLFPEIERLVKYFDANKDEAKQFFENIADGAKEAIPVVVEIAEAAGKLGEFILKSTKGVAIAAAEVTTQHEKRVAKSGKVMGTLETASDILAPLIEATPSGLISTKIMDWMRNNGGTIINGLKNIQITSMYVNANNAEQFANSMQRENLQQNQAIVSLNTQIAGAQQQ